MNVSVVIPVFNEKESLPELIRESLSIDSENTTIQDHLNKVTKAKSDQNLPMIPQAEKQD